jgi:hypothetical protein
VPGDGEGAADGSSSCPRSVDRTLARETGQCK